MAHFDKFIAGGNKFIVDLFGLILRFAALLSLVQPFFQPRLQDIHAGASQGAAPRGSFPKLYRKLPQRPFVGTSPYRMGLESLADDSPRVSHWLHRRCMGRFSSTTALFIGSHDHIYARMPTSVDSKKVGAD